MTSQLVPVKRSWVKQVSPNNDARYGRVVKAFPDRNNVMQVKVEWNGSKKTSIVPLSQLRAGFRPGMEVQNIPNSRTRKPLGEGMVLKTRTLGSRDQVLVDFSQIGKQLWLPYETLRQIKGTKHRFILGDQGPEESAELFRLKSLAYALEMWNENTGSLSHLDIDPLPHQIILVHHILTSGNLNWLIADDVGLGKTIEIGMLLAALKQRGILNRVLLVTPAGLTKQWQEELNNKFRMGEFQIYGEDFHINESRHWKMYDYVIASIDRLKGEEHLELLQQARAWDIVVFDEAHYLSRRQYSLKFKSSQRFRLAAKLRSNTDAMVFLSATPHQGMQDKFQALLELLRPERKNEIATLELNPEIIGDMIFRNNKSDVTDTEGNFVFKGKTTKIIELRVSSAAREFDENLQNYLKQGYARGDKLGAQGKVQKGRAIGFVMTVYRKLAASSIAAIYNALFNRRERLKSSTNESDTIDIDKLEADQLEADQRFSSEREEQIKTGTTEFFEGETKLLGKLISDAERLKTDDWKMRRFIEKLVNKILLSNENEKVLIFTEYRATQSYLKEELESHFGQNSVSLINGSMSHQLRRKAIARFEEDAQFLVSTEAGGEGINLQRKCHIMVNYDLPWNPMRLVQRIGRLYRYGQQRHVIVFNIHSPDTVDERVISLMYSRIDQVVSDMAVIGGGINAQLQDDILGEVTSLLDVEGVIEGVMKVGIERTQERINEALDKAKKATLKQKELFEYAASFDPNETRHELRITQEHGVAFVQGMFKKLNIEIESTTHNGLIWHIRLPESVMQEIETAKSLYEVTLDRILATNRPNTHMLDMDSFLMQYLLSKAKSYDFMGITAVIRSENLDETTILTSLLRWQNEQGQRMRQEYTVYGIADDGRVTVNPSAFSEWLKQTGQVGRGKVLSNREQNEERFNAAKKAADKRLAEVSNQHLHPENNQWISGAWVE